MQQDKCPQSTKKDDNYIRKRKAFCREKGTDSISVSIDHPIEFLTKISELAMEYSAVGTKRSTRSSALIMDNGISFGKQLLV